MKKKKRNAEFPYKHLTSCPDERCFHLSEVDKLNFIFVNTRVICGFLKLEA